MPKVRYRFTVSRTPSLNEVIRQHWAARGRSMQKMAWEVKAAVGKISEPIKRARVTIVRFSVGRLDQDNLYGGCKALIDCLVSPTKKNPHGLGLIHNDDPEVCEIKVFGAKSSRRDQRTEVLIEEL